MNNDLVLSALAAALRYMDGLPPRYAARIAYRLFNTPIGAGKERMGSAQLRESRAVLARAEALDVRVGRQSVRLYRWSGHEGAGSKRRRTVLLTHGWTLGARYMTSFVDPLVTAGFDVAALDFPGHGDSSSTRMAARDSVLAIRACAEVVGGYYAMIGHSFGGSMIVLAAEGSPAVVGPLAVDRIVLLASGDRLADIVSRFADEFRLGEDARTRLIRKLEKVSGRSLDSISVSRSLRTLGIPTLVVHDPGDRVVPFADAERISALPRVELLRADGKGHFRILRSSVISEAIVRFLVSESR